MRKTILTILGIVLLASSAFGNDVLFKMVMKGGSSSNVNVASGANQDLSSYYHFYDLGGSALVHNGQKSEATVIDAGCARITNSDGYIQITLSEGKSLQIGDIISITGVANKNNYLFVHGTGGSSGRPNETPYRITMNNDDLVASYTVVSEDVLVGKSVFYINEGNNATYVKAVTVSRPDNSKEFYSFENENASIAKSVESTLKNGLIVKNDADGHNNITTNNELYLAGDAPSRYIAIPLREPCAKIEVWAYRSTTSDEARSLYLTDNKSLWGQNTLLTQSNTNALTKREKSYDAGSRPYDKNLYISSSKGAWYIRAIRVTYAVRSDANLVIKKDAAAISSLTIPLGATTHTYCDIETSSTVAWKRTASASNIVNIKPRPEETPTQIGFKGLKEGVVTVTISQDASEDYHAAEATLTVTVEPKAKSLATFDVDSEGLTPSGSNPLTKDNYMLSVVSGDDAGFARNSNSIYVVKNINETLTRVQALRLQSGTYRITVPTNIRIEKVTILGQSYSENASSSLSVDGSANIIEFPAKSESTESKTHEFTIKNPAAGKSIDIVVNKASCVIMELYGVESTLYPVTINHGWASFCAPEDVELPEGMTAYYAKEERDLNDDVTLYVVALEGNKVPANEGVILSAETDGAYQLRATTDAPALADNRFGYTTKRTANPNVANTYTLWYDSAEDAVVFAKYTGAYIPANKAYYTYSAPGGGDAPKRIRLVMTNENTATGIESQELKANSQKLIENGQLIIIKNGVRYNAQGQIVK